MASTSAASASTLLNSVATTGEAGTESLGSAEDVGEVVTTARGAGVAGKELAGAVTTTECLVSEGKLAVTCARGAGPGAWN